MTVDRTESRRDRGAATRLRLDQAPHRSDVIVSLALAPDGRWLATRSQDWRLCLWNVASGRLERELPSRDVRVDDMVFSRDGQYLVTAAPETSNSISIWHVPTGRRTQEIAEPGELLLLLDDGRIQTVADHRVVRFEVPQSLPREIIPLREAHHAIPKSFSPDGNTLVLYFEARAQSQYVIRLYDLTRHEQKMATTLGDEPTALAVDRDAEWIAVAEHQNPFIHLRMPPRLETPGLLTGHEDSVQALSLTPDALFLLSAGDGDLRVWDVTSQRLVGMVPDLYENQIALAVSADGRRVAAAGRGESGPACWIWDLTSLLRHVAEPHSRDGEIVAASRAVESLRFEDGMPGLLWCLDHPAEAFSAIQSALHDAVAPWDRETVASLIEQLDDPDYSVRTRAYQLLWSRHGRIKGELRDALRHRISLERRLSVDRLLRGDQREQPLSSEDWRQAVRMVFLLEQFADDNCRQILMQMAESHPDRRIRSAASIADHRLRSYRPRNRT